MAHSSRQTSSQELRIGSWISENEVESQSLQCSIKPITDQLSLSNSCEEEEDDGETATGTAEREVVEVGLENKTAPETKERQEERKMYTAERNVVKKVNPSNQANAAGRSTALCIDHW